MAPCEFRDFVLTRTLSAWAIGGVGPRKGEEAADDAQWTRMVELELVPHPDAERPELAALDFPMVGGVLRVRTRAALAGYVMRRWGVDCSSDHGLRGSEHALWLRDPLALYRVESTAITPGYVPPGRDGAARE